MAEDLDDETKFVAHDWIGVGKTYDPTKIPYFVIIEKRSETAVPVDFLQEAHLPNLNSFVNEFVAWTLPRISSEIISTKVQLCCWGLRAGGMILLPKYYFSSFIALSSQENRCSDLKMAF